jgi:hypothetical protein
LLQALPDFFIKIVLAVQMVKHQIDERFSEFCEITVLRTPAIRRVFYFWFRQKALDIPKIFYTI